MNGIHDMGGMHGFGPVVPELNEPRFHERWEARVLALNLAVGRIGGWNIDRSRHTRESLPPATYLASSYYEIWLRGLENLLVTHGLVGTDELGAGKMIHHPAPGKTTITVDQMVEGLRRGGPCSREVNTPAMFEVGQMVRAKNINPSGHTRLPRYARGKIGEIELVHGGFVFPDTNAALEGEHPQWCYTVRFTGTELWGPDSDPTTSVSVDCFETYLDPVEY